MELNKDWEIKCGLHFTLRTLNNNYRNEWSISQCEIEALFAAVFSSIEYRGLYRAGIVESSKYAKAILKGVKNKIVSPQIAVALITFIALETKHTYDKFITDRLVGRKLVQEWDAIFSQNFVTLTSPDSTVLIQMFTNEDNGFIMEFLKQHEEMVKRKIQEYKLGYIVDF